MTNTWTLASTTPATIMHQRYPGGGAHLRLDLRGPGPAIADQDDYLPRCRQALDADPATLAYRRACEQVTAAQAIADKATADLAEAQAKREELLAAAPGKPTAKQVSDLGASDKRVSDLQARHDDASRGLALLHRRALDARQAVEQAAARIGHETLAVLRRETQARWDETLSKIPAAVAPLLDTLLAIDVQQSALASDSRARQAGLLVHELPPLPAVEAEPEPEPQAVAEPANDEGDDGADDTGVLSLAQRSA